MKLTRSDAEIFIPDGIDADKALSRSTRMCIAAHPDDLEIMAPNLILDCYGKDDAWFCGVVTTDGAGSPRSKLYAEYTDAQMMAVRRREQKKAAVVGEYGAMALLNHPSSAVKNGTETAVKEDLKALITAARPEILGTHNLADKHATHVATALRTLRALRELPAESRPKKLLGFEVWRGLDWMLDEEGVTFDVSSRDNISGALVNLFDSQISGGKRYDLATMGRRRERATFRESHGTDTSELSALAMDLTPLMQDASLDPVKYVEGHIDRFRAAVRKQIEAVR